MTSVYISSKVYRFVKLSVRSTDTKKGLSAKHIPEKTKFLSKSCVSKSVLVG